MAKKTQKPVHHVQMTEGKRNIIQQLLTLKNTILIMAFTKKQENLTESEKSVLKNL